MVTLILYFSTSALVFPTSSIFSFQVVQEIAFQLLVLSTKALIPCYQPTGEPYVG